MQPAKKGVLEPGVADRHCELSGYRGTATAVITTQSFDRAGRWRRALRGLAQCWGLALLGVFIPVAHFFLVPGLGIAGLVVFWRRRNTDIIIVAGRGSCPDCGTEQALDLPSRWSPDLTVDCRQCHRRLRLSSVS